MAITPEQRALIIPGAKPIGKMWDKWRHRKVTVYPTRDPNLVYTVGVSTLLVIGRARPDDVECIEPRALFASVIKRFPNMAVYE